MQAVKGKGGWKGKTVNDGRKQLDLHFSLLETLFFHLMLGEPKLFSPSHLYQSDLCGNSDV